MSNCNRNDRFTLHISYVSEDNDAFDIKGGKNTNDYVSLMSIRETETYFKESSERSVSFTDGTGVWWWLRSPGLREITPQR